MTKNLYSREKFYQDIFNDIAYNAVSTNETPEEFFPLHYRNFVTSGNFSKVLFIFYYDYSMHEVLNNLLLIFKIKSKFNNIKIYVAVGKKNKYQAIYKSLARKNYKYFKIIRYIDILDLIEKYGISKYIYRKSFNRYNQALNFYKTLKFKAATTENKKCIISVNDGSSLISGDDVSVLDKNSSLKEVIESLENASMFYSFADNMADWLAPFYDIPVLLDRNKYTHQIYHLLPNKEMHSIMMVE